MLTPVVVIGSVLSSLSESSKKVYSQVQFQPQQVPIKLGDLEGVKAEVNQVIKLNTDKALASAKLAVLSRLGLDVAGIAISIFGAKYCLEHRLSPMLFLAVNSAFFGACDALQQCMELHRIYSKGELSVFGSDIATCWAYKDLRVGGYIFQVGSDKAKALAPQQAFFVRLLLAPLSLLNSDFLLSPFPRLQYNQLSR